MKRRHNLKIENVRLQKRTQSIKTNALKIYKKEYKNRDKK